jgi:hypothetical protein
MATNKIVIFCDMCGMIQDPNQGGVDKQVEKYILVYGDAAYTRLCALDLCFSDKNRLMSVLRIINVTSSYNLRLLFRKDEDDDRED